jgi:hypothetical protein
LTLTQQEAQLVELSSTKAENLGLRSQLMEKEKELGTYRVGGSRVEGERDAERRKATDNLTVSIWPRVYFKRETSVGLQAS